jgi:hypothetical protein
VQRGWRLCRAEKIAYVDRNGSILAEDGNQCATIWPRSSLDSLISGSSGFQNLLPLFGPHNIRNRLNGDNALRDRLVQGASCWCSSQKQEVFARNLVVS